MRLELQEIKKEMSSGSGNSITKDEIPLKDRVTKGTGSRTTRVGGGDSKFDAFLKKEAESVAAYFGEIHPSITKKIDMKTESLVGFEIFLDNLKLPAKTLNDQKNKFNVSDYQKSERDFAFIINKDVNAQDLINAIAIVDQNLISNIRVFDVYEGDNIPKNQKSIAISVTIQSLEKTLNDNDLENINKSIIETVENKTGAKIRS